MKLRPRIRTSHRSPFGEPTDAERREGRGSQPPKKSKMERRRIRRRERARQAGQDG